MTNFNSIYHSNCAKQPVSQGNINSVPGLGDVHKQFTPYKAPEINYDSMFWEDVQFLNASNNDKLIEWCKAQDPCKSTVATGNKIFNEDKYNAEVESILSEANKLAAELNTLVYSPNFNPEDKSYKEKRNRYLELRSSKVSKDDVEFNEPEFIEVEYDRLEVINLIQSEKDRIKAECRQIEESLLQKKYQNRRKALSNVSDDEWKMLKCGYKFGILNIMDIDRSTLGRGYIKTDISDDTRYLLKESFAFESIEDYFNSPLSVSSNEYEQPKINLTDELKKAILVVHDIIGKYNKFCQIEHEKQLLA